LEEGAEKKKKKKEKNKLFVFPPVGLWSDGWREERGG